MVPLETLRALVDESRTERLAGAFAAGSDLLTLADIDRMLCVEGLRPPFVAMTNASNGLTPWNYAGHMDRVSGGYGASKVRQRTTVILQHLHRRHAPVHSFAMALEAALAPRMVQCNGYLTPADGWGVAPHADQHHTLLMQLSGRKHWRVWSRLDLTPGSHLPEALPGAARRISEVETPLLETWLEPGDLLLIPRGHVHAARTGEQHSLHLTFGVVAPIGLAAAELAFRAQIGGYAGLDPSKPQTPPRLPPPGAPLLPIPSFVEIL